MTPNATIKLDTRGVIQEHADSASFAVNIKAVDFEGIDEVLVVDTRRHLRKLAPHEYGFEVGEVVRCRRSWGYGGGDLFGRRVGQCRS